jgi:DNA polymerase-3 subunit delta
MGQTEKPLLPLYLFNGDDILKHQHLLDRLQERVSLLGDLTLNLQVFSAKDIHDAQSLLDALNTMPFASPLRLVVVKDVDSLSKNVQEALADYAAAPAETTVLALTAKRLAASNRLFKVIKKQSETSIVDCSSKKRSELPPLIRNMAKSEGVDITTTAIAVLLELVGTSTVSLNTEVKKLAAIAKGSDRRSIDENDVLRNVARLSEPKPWDLADALANRDTSLCLRLIEQMTGTTPIGLLAHCTTRIRELLIASTLKKRGASVAQALGKQEWQIKAIMRGTTLYSSEELESILKKTPEIERQMKTGGNPETLLRVWIIGTCTKKTAIL